MTCCHCYWSTMMSEHLTLQVTGLLRQPFAKDRLLNGSKAAVIRLPDHPGLDLSVPAQLCNLLVEDACHFCDVYILILTLVCPWVAGILEGFLHLQQQIQELEGPRLYKSQDIYGLYTAIQVK
jgi:hypothetical protein